MTVYDIHAEDLSVIKEIDEADKIGFIARQGFTDSPDAEESVGIDVENREQLIKVFRIRPGQAAFPVADGTDRDLQRLRQVLRRHVGFLSELLNLQAEPFQVPLFRGLAHCSCFTHPISRSLQHLRRRASIISAS